MSLCARLTCGHPTTAHDELGFCSLCSCTAFEYEEDAVLDEPLVLDDEDELDFGGEGDA